MNVYIVYRDDGLTNTYVEVVFAKEEHAIKFVIERIFNKNSFYDNMTQEVKEKYALEHIERHEVRE